MAQDTNTTDVLFRIFKGADADREVFALFPGLAGTMDPYTCSYSRVGQHSSADLNGCIARSRPADPAEYGGLFAELGRVGYRLRVVHKSTRRHFRERLEQTQRANAKPAPTYLWVRLGDGSDYSKFDSIAEAAEYCREFNVPAPQGWTSSGFTAPGYEEQNYVSFYWGDSAADLTRVLTTKEQTQTAALWTIKHA